MPALTKTMEHMLNVPVPLCTTNKVFREFPPMFPLLHRVGAMHGVDGSGAIPGGPRSEAKLTVSLSIHRVKSH